MDDDEDRPGAGRARRNLQYDGGFAGGTGNTQSSYVHNPANQLYTESRTNDAYAWTASVAVSRSYAVNGQNQYTGTTSNGSASATFTHDANGNLISDGTTTFAYDAENRLVSASGAKNATLVYDPLGRLFQVHSPATGFTQFLYDGDELVAEYDGAGTLLRRYIHGDGSDDPLFWYEGAGFDQPRFPHTNHQGSVTAIAGPGSALLAINTYDEYGIPGANNIGRFQYTGQAWIPELGLYYYKARFYSPTLGRFLQTDPIGYDDQINLYAYVGNDPINKTDPTGTEGACTYTADACGMRTTDSGRVNRQVNAGRVMAASAVGATALITRGVGMPGAYVAFRAGGMAGLRAFMGLRVPMTVSSTQLGKKFGSHMKDWGLTGGRSALDKFKAIIDDIGTRPDRVVNGTFSGAGGRVPVQFRIKGSDVVITSRRGEFVSVLRNGLNNGNVQNALKQFCTGSRIARTSC